MKTVLLKDLDKSTEEVISAETWEELYDSIYFSSYNGSMSTKETVDNNPTFPRTVVKLSLEECGCGWSVVVEGKELASSLNNELATTLFTSLVVTEVMKKERNE
jgi:hypothetical protein